VRLEDIVTDGVVISVHQMNLSTVISLAFSNGAIEFRDRVSMKLIESDDNFIKVSSMQQIGFSFSSDEPCEITSPPYGFLLKSTKFVAGLHMATSPNSCLAVALASDGKARLKTMQYRSGTLATSTDDRRQNRTFRPSSTF